VYVAHISDQLGFLCTLLKVSSGNTGMCHIFLINWSSQKTCWKLAQIIHVFDTYLWSTSVLINLAGN